MSENPYLCELELANDDDGSAAMLADRVNDALRLCELQLRDLGAGVTLDGSKLIIDLGPLTMGQRWTASFRVGVVVGALQLKPVAGKNQFGDWSLARDG